MISGWPEIAYYLHDRKNLPTFLCSATETEINDAALFCAKWAHYLTFPLVYVRLSSENRTRLFQELCTAGNWKFVSMMIRQMHRIPFQSVLIPEWIGQYQVAVREQRDTVMTLLAFKRRRIPSMFHLDRFLVRELALVMWACRE